MDLLIALCGFALVANAQTYEEAAVATILMGEAWSEGQQGMIAVAEVIHQRAQQKGWTALRVVTAHRGRIHAFSCLNGTTMDKLIAKFKPEPDYQKALQIAKMACQTPRQLPGITKEANHYSRVEERPYWAKGHEPVVIIGRHAFYKLKHF
ncbi:MAG TPA: cell wall hydrolase [Verrucomicrobiae bacterium]|nr:cell wall hydrolase [Verrucomicrobiae bacterium]